MGKIRNSNHIRTHRTLKSFRACPNATGAPQALPDCGRAYHEECRRLNRELQRAGQCPAPRRHPGA